MPTTFAVDELNFCVRYGNRWILIAIITGMAPLVGLEATSKMQKGRNLGHNIAKITKISPFSAVTFFIYQNFPETNCENDFFITFTDYSVKRSKLIVYSYNLAYS